MNAVIAKKQKQREREKHNTAEAYRRRLSYAVIAMCTMVAIILAGGYSLVTTTADLSDTNDYAARLEKKTTAQSTEIRTLNNTVERLDKEIQSLNQQESIKHSQINSLAGSIANLNSIIKELDLSNEKLVKENKKLTKKLKAYQQREELYDKYAYAVFDKGGNRTDLTYDQIKTGEELMLEKGMDPDLLFGIIMTESGGRENASNSTSTARGYGQVLIGTARTVYEDMQGHGKGSYYHDLAYNGDVNISLIVSYLDWMRKNGWSLNKTIVRYRGLDDPAYFRSIDSYVRKGGNSLSNISAKW